MQGTDEEYIKWLQDEMEDALLDLLRYEGPIYWDSAKPFYGSPGYKQAQEERRPPKITATLTFAGIPCGEGVPIGTDGSVLSYED